jgi:DOPA 4,5-dioxygenase
MLNRDGLRILVHPMTGDIVADHTANPIWLGEPLPLDVAFLRKYVAEQRAASASS